MSQVEDLLVSTAQVLEATAETIATLEQERETLSRRLAGMEKRASVKIDWTEVEPLVQLLMRQGATRKEARERINELAEAPQELIKVASRIALEVGVDSIGGGRPLFIGAETEADASLDPDLLLAQAAARRLQQQNR